MGGGKNREIKWKSSWMGGSRRAAILWEEAGISSWWVQETSETQNRSDYHIWLQNQTFQLRNDGLRYLQLAGRAPYLRMIWSCVNFTKDSYCSGKKRRWRWECTFRIFPCLCPVNNRKTAKSLPVCPLFRWQTTKLCITANIWWDCWGFCFCCQKTEQSQLFGW